MNSNHNPSAGKQTATTEWKPFYPEDTKDLKWGSLYLVQTKNMDIHIFKWHDHFPIVKEDILAYAEITPCTGKSQTQKIIDKHLEECFSIHKEKIPICYLPYIHKIVNEILQEKNNPQ